MAMRLSSSGFKNGGAIARRFTCDGENCSPPLAWSGAPAETRSFALVCRDPDAPAGVFYHWAAFDVAADADGLPEHCPPGSAAMRQATSDFGRPGYGGPCPPRGHGPHHYHFTLYALDVERLAVPARAHCREVEAAARSRALATAELVGIYER
jgi:Raf kinase inhibitor-like YbhB/YbcL family protein